MVKPDGLIVEVKENDEAFYVLTDKGKEFPDELSQIERFAEAFEDYLLTTCISFSFLTPKPNSTACLICGKWLQLCRYMYARA